MIAFTLFWWPVYWYGIFYGISFLLIAVFIALSTRWLMKSWMIKQWTDHADVLSRIQLHREDLMTALMGGMLVWWRLGHVFFYDFAYFAEHPFQVFSLWNGGMSYLWWIIGVSAAAIGYARRHRLSRRNLGSVMDIFCAIIPIGSLIGRRGNFLNQELYGRVFLDVFPNSRLPFAQQIFLAVQYPSVDMAWRINSSLVASVTEWFLLLCLVQYVWRSQFFGKKKLYPRRVTVIFLLWYVVIRFFLEWIRQDGFDETIRWLWVSLSITQWVIVFWLLGVCLAYGFFRFTTQKKESEK